MAEALSARNLHARRLFAPLGPTYDRYSALLSLGQDPRWRRFLVSRVRAGPDDTVLDVATGTAAVAVELVRRTGCSVVGLDQSAEMLAVARARLAEVPALADRVTFVRGEAERLLELWRAAGTEEVGHRRLSLGGGIVVWGRRR